MGASTTYRTVAGAAALARFVDDRRPQTSAREFDTITPADTDGAGATSDAEYHLVRSVAEQGVPIDDAPRAAFAQAPAGR